jgi:hypothetical protein
MFNKLSLSKLDQYLRSELKIPPYVSIKIHSNIEKGWEDSLGSKFVMGTFFINKDTPTKSFHVAFQSTLNVDKIVETICHEYVHIAQIASGRWVRENSYQMWNGIRFEIAKTALTSREYKFTTPWEIEAYTMEKDLSSNYKKESSKSTLLDSLRFFLFST